MISGTFIVTTFGRIEAGFTFISLSKLRISSPAPTSSTNASATSDTTSAWRISRRPALPADPRPPSFRTPAGSRRDALKRRHQAEEDAGQSASAVRNATTRQSRPTTACDGR